MMSDSIIDTPAHWRSATLGELCAGSDSGIFVGANSHAATADSAKFKTRAGDILCTRRGDAGRPGLIGDDNAGDVCSDGHFLVRTSSSNIHPRYLFQYLAHPNVQGWLKRQAPGATMKHLKKSFLSALPVAVPPISEQRRLADMTAPIDEKISVLARINATLERAMRVILQSMQSSDSRQAALSECCQRIENGRTPARSNPAFWDADGIPWLTSGEVRQSVIVSTQERISQEGMQQSYLKLWPKRTTVVALFGSTAGQVARLAIDSCANQACCGLVPKPGYEALIFLRLSAATEALRRQTNGSVIAALNQKTLAEFPIEIPAERELARLNQIVEPMLEKIAFNLRQTAALSQLRDALIRKFFAGELQPAKITKRRLVQHRVAEPAGV